MKKILLTFSLGLICAFLLVACGTPTNQQTAGNKPGEANKTAQTGGDKKIRIGFVMDTLKEERWNRDKELFEKRCAELQVQCEVTVAQNDASRQANDVDNFLTKGVDVLVIVPSNATQAAAMVSKAKAQGIPVISYDRLIISDQLDLYISHQAVKIGEMQAKYALEKAPKGNYVMIYGASTDNNAIILKDAQKAVLKEAIERGDIKIVAEQHATDWKPEEALKIAENALTQNKNDVVAIVASNDGTAGGAAQAIAKEGLAAKIILTGQDCELAAMQRIAEGKQTMTIYKPIQPLAYGAVDAAIKLARKEPVEAKDKIKAEGMTKEIPSILYEPMVVDKSNIMKPITDGYHKFEDVFKNVPAEERPKQ